MINSPIVIVEDDVDDSDFIQSALNDIGIKNEVKRFANGQEALDYLQHTSDKTFLIVSDVNMPIVNGFELKREINKDNKLRMQSIPFIFLSTTRQAAEVDKGYQLMVQGFFQKPNTYDDIKILLSTVTNYWRIALHPKAMGL